MKKRKSGSCLFICCPFMLCGGIWAFLVQLYGVQCRLGGFFFCKFVDLRCLRCCQFIAKRIDFRVCFDNLRWFQGCLHPNQVFIAIRLWRKPQSLSRTLDAFHNRSEARSFCPEILFLFNVCTKQHLFCAIVKMPSSTEVVFREAFVLKSSVLKFEYGI